MDAYIEAVGDQAVLTNAPAIGVIPFSAAALGLGITGSSPNAVTALGLSGAAGFGISPVVVIHSTADLNAGGPYTACSVRWIFC